MARTMVPMLMAVLGLTGLAGCKDDPNPCDSTTYLSGSDCMPYMDAALPGPDAAAPSDQLAATEAAAPSVDAEISEAGAASKLGLPCSDNTTHAECQGPDTDYCAIQPGSSGYCTKSGCVTNDDCPTGWTCFDLEATYHVAGYPTMCTKPTS